METALRERIYNDFYFGDAYIWVNEVLDYAGGKDYGKRLIHPNLPETEGLLLSTDMEDVAGGKPYLEELEGVRQKGEIFFTYYFKKLTTDSIEKKITFARLYEPYDWIVAMGVYYDNLEEHIAAASNETAAQRKISLSLVGLISVSLILVGSVAFLWAERVYYTRSTGVLKTELETDLLTGAGSRRAALAAISAAFQSFKASGGLYSLFMLDLDDFKIINDSYGHDIGDSVLVRVVASIKKVIREEDILCRWGGEEFILLTRGLAPENLDLLINKILAAVEQSSCNQEGLDIKTTISIGATCFLESDTSYDDALKRADNGLYRSKRSGKNKGTKVFS